MLMNIVNKFKMRVMRWVIFVSHLTTHISYFRDAMIVCWLTEAITVGEKSGAFWKPWSSQDSDWHCPMRRGLYHGPTTLSSLHPLCPHPEHLSRHPKVLCSQWYSYLCNVKKQGNQFGHSKLLMPSKPWSKPEGLMLTWTQFKFGLSMELHVPAWRLVCAPTSRNGSCVLRFQ